MELEENPTRAGVPGPAQVDDVRLVPQTAREQPREDGSIAITLKEFITGNAFQVYIDPDADVAALKRLIHEEHGGAAEPDGQRLLLNDSPLEDETERLRGLGIAEGTELRLGGQDAAEGRARREERRADRATALRESLGERYTETISNETALCLVDAGCRTQADVWSLGADATSALPQAVVKDVKEARLQKTEAKRAVEEAAREAELQRLAATLRESLGKRYKDTISDETILILVDAGCRAEADVWSLSAEAIAALPVDAAREDVRRARWVKEDEANEAKRVCACVGCPICILSMVAGGAIQQAGVWATSPFGDDYRPEALVVGGAALLLVGALGFEFGLDHEVAHPIYDYGDRGGWDSLKEGPREVQLGWPTWPTWKVLLLMLLVMLFYVLLFPLGWLVWVFILCGKGETVEDSFFYEISLKDDRIRAEEGGVLVVFLWGVLSSLAATAWICLWDWTAWHSHHHTAWHSWYPALVSVAALVVVLLEAINEAAVMMKGERRSPPLRWG
eukprot:COSAG04_NODE_500_length_13366_cov_33.972488_14_plen_508_part_00